MGDTLKIFGRTYPNTNGFKAEDEYGNVLMFTKGGITSIWQDDDGAIVLNDENGNNEVDYLTLRAHNEKCSYTNNKITSLETGYFIDGWTNLSQISLPNCIAFKKGFAMGANGNDNLLAYFPKLQTMTGQSFQNFRCQVLALPEITGVANYAFYSSKIPIIDLGKNCASIGGTHSLDGNVSTLIIRYNSVCSLSATNSLPPATFGSSGTGGTLYVPSSQISAYQSATNWSTILGYTNNQILPIEGSEYEHYYADGTEVTS